MIPHAKRSIDSLGRIAKPYKNGVILTGIHSVLYYYYYYSSQSSRCQEEEERERVKRRKGDGEKEKGNGCDLGQDESVTIPDIEGGAQARSLEDHCSITDIKTFLDRKFNTTWRPRNDLLIWYTRTQSEVTGRRAAEVR